MRKILSYAVACAMAVSSLVAPASAQVSGARAPVAAAAVAASDVEQVQNRRVWRERRAHRGGRYYGNRRYYRGNRYYGGRRYYRGDRYYSGRRYYRHRYGYRDNGAAIALGVFGLAAGAAIANQNRYSSGDAYCAQRFRSYDPRSGTYLGYDGRRHACP